MFEYKTLVVQDVSSFAGPHVTEIDGQSLQGFEDAPQGGQQEVYNYVPLHVALNRLGRDGWEIDHSLGHIVDGVILILKRRVPNQ